jgi:hypothetical protein
MLVCSPRPNHIVTGVPDKVGNLCYKVLQYPDALRHAKTPMPCVDEILMDCTRRKIWATIDMTDSFFQMHVHIKLVKVTRLGIEPRTFWTYTKCFNQLSYPAIPWRTSFSMIPQTIRGEQPCAQISISDSPCRPYVYIPG